MGTVIATEVPWVDFVFSGPALHSFPQFLRYSLDGTPDLIHTVPGILSRSNRDDPRSLTTIGRDRHIDDFIQPEYGGFVRAFSTAKDRMSALDNDTSVAKTQPALFFETSRGCWWGQRSHCTFCGLNGVNMDYRAMAGDLAKRQFEWLFQFAPWCTEFDCTDNIMPKNYPREVFSTVRSPRGTSIFYEIKLPLSEGDMRLLARAGVTRLQPGVEALSTATLKLMGKGTTAFLNLQFLKNCIRHTISPIWNLLIGFPGESRDVYSKYATDIPNLVHLPPPSGAHMVRFDRFSPYHSDPTAYGLKLRPMDFYGMVYPFDDMALDQLAYYFADDSMAPYMLNAAEWSMRLNELIHVWGQAWRNPDGRPILRLERDNDGNPCVHDTRSGADVWTYLDAASAAILRRLQSPGRTDRLAQELGLTSAEVSDRLADFAQRRMLFTEEGQVLSLVIVEDELSSD